MMNFLRILFGPNVKRIYCHGGEPSRPYRPESLEQNCQKILNIISVTKSILYYTWPVWTLMLFRRGYFTVSYGVKFLEYSAWFSCVYFGILLIRGIGRRNNQDYIDFISVLERSKVADDGRKGLYDFDFGHWSVDYEWRDSGKNVIVPPYHLAGRVKKIKKEQSLLSFVFKGVPLELIAYTISHSIGLSMVYPGSTAPFNAVIKIALEDGRNKLIENHGGKRVKLVTKEKFELDAMFVDRRVGSESTQHVQATNGNDLVICCEGNAGFYEIGIMVTPLEAGYSVLGFNRPGFGWSTGTPYPAAEINTIETVMQYATKKLNFEPRNIIVFGWSIGGFTALHACQIYPDIKALFLDATFDDVLPLALKAMPASVGNIVEYTMRGYINLHHSELLKQCKQPVHFVRRQMDEVMNKDGQRNVSSNCGNPLLYKFLLHRFPALFGNTEADIIQTKVALDSWLAREDDTLREAVFTDYDVNEQICETILKSYIRENSAEYPIMIGDDLSTDTKEKLVLYLASKHMSHFESTHCSPLPSNMFILPWDVTDLLKGDSKSTSSDEFEIVNGSNDQMI